MLPFFFYGTLMDDAVLSAVIGRRVSSADLSAAVIHGFKRVYARDVTYPVLCSDPEKIVDGYLFHPHSTGEQMRLDAFEGRNYDRVIREVYSLRGVSVQAQVYLPVSGVTVTNRVWHFDDWKRRHRSQYLKRVRQWQKPG